MGNAFGAVANDFNAIFFNPAGLATVRQVEVSGNAGRLFSENSPQTEAFAAGTLPLKVYRESWDQGTLGFLLHRTGQPGDNTVTSAGVSVGISPADFISKKLFAVNIPERIYTGASLRIRQINRAGTGNSNYGIGMDIGFLYQFEENVKAYMNGWSVSAAILEMNTQSVSSPVSFRLGSAWKNPPYTVAMDFVSEDGVGRFFPGAEVALFKKLLLLRAGTGVAPGKSRQIVLGVGTLLPPIQLDLAYGFPTSDLSKSNDRIIVSFTYRFGTPFLSQYLDEANRRKISEVENKFANMEFKRATLEAGIRENRALYEKISSDLNRARVKSEAMEKEMKSAEEALAQKRKELERLQKEIQNIQSGKGGAGKGASAKDGERTPSAPEARRHRVVKGDTLRDLAQKYYGDPNKWGTIYDSNQEKFIRGVPRPGEELIIPPARP
jgi:nucleoid-associated protein YgaU